MKPESKTPKVSVMNTMDATPAVEVATTSNNCHPQWWRDQGLRRLNTLLAVVAISSVVQGYDYALIGSFMAMPGWYQDLGLAPDDGHQTGLVVASQSLGSIIIFPINSFMADRLGRKAMLVCGNIFILGAVIGQVFCINLPRVYILTRFLLGMGVMTNITSSPVLISELSHPRHRARMVSTYGSMCYLGGFLSAWISFASQSATGSWGWRIPTILQIAPTALQLLFIWAVPESPRWLVSQGRHTEARDILARYHANGDEADDLVQLEYHEMCQTIASKKQSELADWLFFVSNIGGLRRLVIIVGLAIMVNWSGAVVVNYYFAIALRAVGIVKPVHQIGISGGLHFVNVVAATCSSVFLVGRLGRRALFLTSTSITLAAMVGTTICAALFDTTGNVAASYGMVVMFFVFQIGIDIALVPLTATYITEICPFHLRTKGMSLHLLTVCGSAAATQYANPVALAAIGWRYYLVCIGVIVAGLLMVYFCFPETRGSTIEEVASLFDGEVLATGIVAGNAGASECAIPKQSQERKE